MYYIYGQSGPSLLIESTDSMIDKPWLSWIYRSYTTPSTRAKPEGKAVIMPEGGSIWELYHGCYLGYKPNQDINIYIRTYMQGNAHPMNLSRARLLGLGRLLFFCASATCGYYSRAATIRCATIIRINTVLLIVVHKIYVTVLC